MGVHHRCVVYTHGRPVHKKGPMRLVHGLLVSSAMSGIMSMVVAVAACSSFGAVYPPRPPESPAPPIADPTPARIVAHVSVTAPALSAALDGAVPKTGDGTFALGGQRHYTWERSPLDVSFSQGRLVLDTHVTAKVDLRVSSLQFVMDLHVVAEPVVNTEYKVKLQSTDVKVTSTDSRLKVAEAVAGALDTIGAEVNGKLKDFAYDLKPMLEEAYARVAKPIELPVGDAKGCASLKVLGVEAGPTVVADGIEKDLALVVAPSVTIPCAEDAQVPVPLPALANVATMTPGPFTVTIPVAARYDELTRAMSIAFTDGKLFFSPEYPKLYLEKPELYESQGVVVLKLHLTGPVHKLGIDADLDGNIFLSGHIAVVDNELAVPDLEPTIETSNFLLSLKVMADGALIRDQARAALRLDIGERLRAVREKLGSDLTFGGRDACFQGNVDKIEVTGAYAHGTYVRVYVAVTGRAAVSMPCAIELKAPEVKAPTQAFR